MSAAATTAANPSITGWVVGYILTIIVVVVVVALVGTILVLAHSIGQEAAMIDESLTDSVHNTAALAQLNTTIEHAEVIVDGLARGRARLGG